MPPGLPWARFEHHYRLPCNPDGSACCEALGNNATRLRATANVGPRTPHRTRHAIPERMIGMYNERNGTIAPESSVSAKRGAADNVSGENGAFSLVTTSTAAACVNNANTQDIGSDLCVIWQETISLSARLHMCTRMRSCVCSCARGCVTVLSPWQALTQPLSWYDVDSPKYLVRGTGSGKRKRKTKTKI